jgi:hypothetical protein
MQLGVSDESCRRLLGSDERNCLICLVSVVSDDRFTERHRRRNSQYSARSASNGRARRRGHHGGTATPRLPSATAHRRRAIFAARTADISERTVSPHLLASQPAIWTTFRRVSAAFSSSPC